MDRDTFDRVQQRLEDNKRFAARNTKVPSLLQGLAACASCGYGYYRTSTTTSSGKKIYYYRCLGSDDYRYQGGRVCGNKPVRADYVDAVIWDHVTGLLADPALIRTEIDRRLERARTSNPVTKKRGQLEQALAKTSASIAAMVTAFSEQLITIDELRARMPDLRARETGLKDQIAALDAQAADRDAYLKLAGDLEGFLTRLRGSAAIATVEDRQRVLRAVVQDVLVGPEKLTIRHRIPVREPSSGSGHHETTDTEGDMRESSLLRWGRGAGPLRSCPVPQIPEEHGHDHRPDPGIHLRQVDGGGGLGHPEAVGDAGPFDVLAPRLPHLRRVVERDPGDQPGVPRIRLRDVVRLRVVDRLPGQQRRGIGPAVVPRPRKFHPDRLGDQVRNVGERRPQPVLAGRADAVVVVREDVLVPGSGAVTVHRPGRGPRAVQVLRDLRVRETVAISLPSLARAAVICTGAAGAAPASMVHRTSTLRFAVSTLTGRANTSDR